MNIRTRLVRLFKADVHGFLDQLEDKSLLLKQYLRDMEEALTQKESRLQELHSRRGQIVLEKESYCHIIEKLEQDVAIAIQKGKDAIALELLKKIKSQNIYKQELEQTLEMRERNITQLQTCFAEQQVRYQQLRVRCEEYFRRAAQPCWNNALPYRNFVQEYTEEEIELELLQRKEAVQGGISR